MAKRLLSICVKAVEEDRVICQRTGCRKFLFVSAQVKVLGTGGCKGCSGFVHKALEMYVVQWLEAMGVGGEAMGVEGRPWVWEVGHGCGRRGHGCERWSSKGGHSEKGR